LRFLSRTSGGTKATDWSGNASASRRNGALTPASQKRCNSVDCTTRPKQWLQNSHLQALPLAAARVVTSLWDRVISHAIDCSNRNKR
jgi:hypothetical protein